MNPAGSRVILTTHVSSPGATLVDWLAWHRVIGVTELHVCTPRRDGRAPPLLAALADAGVLRVVPVAVDPEPGEESRNAALRAGALEGGESGGCGLFLLPDEYLCLDDATPDIPALMSEADVMTVPLREAGTGGQAGPAPESAQWIGAPLRSVVRLGLFGARTPEVPVGPVAGGAPLTWLDGDGAPLPAPQSRVAWARAGYRPGGGRAAVMRLMAPSGEGGRARAAIAGPHRDTGARAVAHAAEIRAIMALPGVADAQAALDAEAHATSARLFPDAAPAPSPEAAPPKKVTDAQQETEASRAPTLPGWFAEIHTGGTRQGFYSRLENHAVMCIRRDPARLVVTFDNVAYVNDLSPEREPWAYRFVRDNGASHLSVMARRKDWYRCPQLIAYLQKLADDGLFAEFAQVWLSGTSMGGFGALAFASLAPGATVIAFSPQTTLDATLVPWEERFAVGRARNWSLPHSDAAFEIDEAARVFVLFDPFFAPDRRHVARLEGENVTCLETWCSGHFSPVFLRRAGLLKPVMQHALDDTLTPAVFYRLYRARRRLPWYRKALQGYLTERGHDRLARRVRPAFRRLMREAVE